MDDIFSLKELREKGVLWFPKKQVGGFYAPGDQLTTNYSDWKLLTVSRYNEKIIKLECSSGKNITIKSDNQKLLDHMFEVLSNERYLGQSLESIKSQKLFIPD